MCWDRLVALVAGVSVLVVVGCSAQPKSPASSPRIPTITVPTSSSRTPVMVDRPLPDDCELVVPAEQMNQVLGQQLPGEPKLIIGIPEPGTGRTGKIDCYYGIPPGKPLRAAVVIVGLASYVDELAARTRVTDSVEAERQSGATIKEIEVGKQRASLVSTVDERLVIGSLGKTTFVVRAKTGVRPEDTLGPPLALLAAQSMTPPV